MTMPTNPIARSQKRLCAAREVLLRKRVYPGLVERGRMTQAEADREIAAMQAIADDYREPDLFAPNAPLRSALR